MLTTNLVADLIDKVTPSVVSIYGTGGDQAKGTGFIVDKNGTVATCYHVVQHSRYVHVEMWDGEKLTAQVVSFDKYTDVAILKLDLSEYKKQLHTVQFAPHGETRVGDFCVSLGANLGLTGTANFGIVSAFRRPESVGVPVYTDYLLQTVTNPILTGYNILLISHVKGRCSEPWKQWMSSL